MSPKAFRASLSCFRGVVGARMMASTTFEQHCSVETDKIDVRLSDWKTDGCKTGREIDRDLDREK